MAVQSFCGSRWVASQNGFHWNWIPCRNAHKPHSILQTASWRETADKSKEMEMEEDADGDGRRCRWRWKKMQMEMEEDADGDERRCRWRWKKLVAGLLENMYIILRKFADGVSPRHAVGYHCVFGLRAPSSPTGHSGVGLVNPRPSWYVGYSRSIWLLQAVRHRTVLKKDIWCTSTRAASIVHKSAR